MPAGLASSVDPAGLDRVEQEIITGLRNEGVLLRNRTLMSQPLGKSALDAIVSQEEQAAWISADFRDADVVVAPERIELARARTLADPDRLPTPMRMHPQLMEALKSIAIYLYSVIPFPHETEGRGWVLSAWSSTNRTRNHRRLCTLSIQNVELLFLFEDRSETGAWEQMMVLNVAPTLPDTSELGNLFDDGAYRTAGPVKTAYLAGWHDLDDVLSDPDVLLAARELALGQLRKGRAMFSRFHTRPWRTRCSHAPTNRSHRPRSGAILHTRAFGCFASSEEHPCHLSRRGPRGQSVHRASGRRRRAEG